MPSHFAHIYLARRVAAYLAAGKVPVWTEAEQAAPLQGVVDRYGAAYCGQVMQTWEKFTAVGAIGPDLFYFSQDYAGKVPGLGVVPPSDELMLSLAIYYFYRDNLADEWEPLLVILEEVSTFLGAIVRFLVRLEQIWDDFKGVWDATVGPLVNAADSALDDLTGGLVSQFSDGLQRLKTAFVDVVEQEVFEKFDLYNGMNTCVAKGWDEQSFTWGDMLHYRQTTSVPRSLVEQAELLRETHPERCEQLLALAFGWCCHIGGDVIGHSFVNTQAGGPFRNHPTRHHLIENHIDAWVYHQARPDGPLPDDPIAANDTYPNLTRSGLAFAVHMTANDPKGKARPPTLPEGEDAEHDALKIDGELPPWVAEEIVQALVRVYGSADPPDPDAAPVRPTHPRLYGGRDFQRLIDQNLLTGLAAKVFGSAPATMLVEDIAPTPHVDVPPGFPLPWQVQVCYRLMMTFYGMSFTAKWELDKPRRPDPVIFPPTSDVESLLSPPDFSGASSGDPLEDVCGALKSLLDWVQKEIDAATTLAGDLVKMLASPGSYGPRLLLYELTMMVWDVICKTHEMLVHIAILVPHGEQRYDDGELRLANEIDQTLITLGGTVDDAFLQAMADAVDPLGGLDRDPTLVVGHLVPDPVYPLYQVVRHDAGGIPTRDSDHKVSACEFLRPWAYPLRSPGPDPHIYFDTRSERILDPDARGRTAWQAQRTSSGPFPSGTMPDQVFFGTDDIGDADQREAYEQSAAPQDTEGLSRNFLAELDRFHTPLGAPVPFAAYLIGRVRNDPAYRTHFNLDSDRAYGYLTWDWVRTDETMQEDLPYLYRTPATWPQLAAGWRYPPVPLALEYIDTDKPLPEPPPTPPQEQGDA